MKRHTDLRRTRRSLGILYLAAVAIPASALAWMPPGGRVENRPDTTALSSEAPLPDYCLPPNTAALIARCPAGVSPGEVGEMGGGVIPTAAASDLRQPDRPSATQEDTQRRGPGISQRPDDPRRRGAERRIEDLIKREIELTQRLLRTTPNTDPTKPDIYFRIAQLFYEMQDNRNFAAGEFDMQALDAETQGNQNRANELYQQRDTLRAEAMTWGDQAIEAYREIVRSFRDWERIDEALFYLAFAFEERARAEDDPEAKEQLNYTARSVYNALIQEHQGSRYIPNAYLSFAEYYFNEEGNMSRAMEYYDKILRIPNNPVYGYAMYKKAWCWYNMQEYQNSLNTFREIVEWGLQHPEDQDSVELVRTARLELPTAYAQVGRPDQAWALFERVGGDLVVRMMESLAEYYYAQGQHEEAIIAYHVLMDKNRNSDRLCDYQYWVTQCRMAQASTAAEAGRGVTSAGAKDLIVEEIRNMIKVWQLFVVETGPQRSATARQTCTWWAADFAIDTAVRWHREAAGSDTQPGTNDRNTMAKAAELYQLFLENFGDRTSAFYYDTLEPPPEWEYQNPYSVYKAHYYAAELLWKAEQWEACGQAFDSVVQADPAGEYAQEAAYASVLCYKKLYDQQYEAVQRVLRSDTGERAQTARDRQRAQARGAGSTWGTSIPASREFTPQEGAMEQAFHRYICYIEQGEDLANVKFNRAFLYLDANRWQEAAALFKQISAEYRGAADSDDRRIAVLSAMNYFEIIVRLKRAGVEQCTPEILAATAEILDGQFPTAGDAAVLENADERSSLTIYLEAVPVLHCAQMLLQVKDLTEQRKWELAAELAVKIHDEFPQTYPGYRCLDNDGQDMMDDILNEAANYFEAANKIMRAIGLRNRLVQEHPDSSHVANAQFGVAQAYARLAFFDRAAQEYEAFARNRATGREADERAPEAMLNAVQIRIGLGQDDQAKADAEFLDQRFGSNRKYQRKAAEAYFQIGELYTSVRNWTQVISHYDEYLRKFGRKGGKEFEVRANMLVAGAYWEQARCAPDEEDDARLRRCRTNKDKAFEYAQKANGLVTLPTFRDPEPDSPEAQIDPGELRLQRRQATWAALVEALDLEIEEEDPAAREAITFARGGKVADAIGQARFYIGEKIYEQFLRIAWPAFEPDDWNPSGGVVSTCIASMGLPRNICVSMEKYKMWTERKFVPFARDRNDKINEARRYYDSIAYLEVPTWEIAAASRVGDMYLQFWRDMYNAPTPPAFRRPEFMEVENAYREALDNNAQIYKDQAIEAFSYCLMTATREQWFNEFSQRCEAALFEIDPGRYRVSFEVYPSPALNRLHYAPPDLDLSLITSVGELGERVVAVPPVPGVPTINDQGRYRFHRQPEEAPAAAAPAAE